jgi:Carbohydrate binding module (family 6)/F5/8 type C domain/Abnormal spindle-like microcephaly-assoc'd, ASPM-SPD-2-Hydin
MSLTGHASTSWQYRSRPRRLVLFFVLAVTAAFLSGFHTPMAQAASSPTTPIWSTQLDFDNNGTPWSESFFAGLASDGLTTAELNMPWGTIEPSAGTFNFTEWDTELANASAAGIQLIPIFWQAGWGGSPAPWITDFEVGSGGAQGGAPTWWDATEQSEYFTYVTDTIQNSVNQPGGYGGANLNYGYLDAQWDLSGAGGGYAAADVSEFHNTYLPQTYSTIATFNSDNGTSYSAFSQVPAAAPGAALFGVFQAFRAWSVQQTYGQLTADVRNITSTPLYYYFGGGFGNATNYANNPDTFFQLAKQYNVTIVDDDASSQGLTLTFGSLARAYGVKVAQEWTAPPDSTQLAAKAVSWISLYALGLPEGGGEDFFIHDGTQKDTVGFPIYTNWLPELKGLSGTYPQQPAAVYIDFSQGYGNTGGGSLNNVENDLANLWLNYQAGFTVVTSQEVKNGAVSLSQFKAVLPLNGVDANLNSYKSGGGVLLTGPAQLTQYTTPYAEIDAPDVGVLQTVPAVATSGTSASITLANITSGTTYNAPIAFSPAGLGLKSGNYYLVNAANGAAVPQTQQASGLVCAAANIGPATLAQWHVVAGTPPSGTASSGCPVTETGATSVTATAGQTNPGLQFLGVGQTNSGADGNLTQITQAGEQAVETWTSSQSGAGDANVYLQLNPMSAVEAAANVTVQVTYWATAGQGFTVQYDTAGNAYQNGPTVTSPGTGTWATASVQLTGAQFSEAQNGGADLRLNVTNAGVPLIVQSITMSSASSSGPVLTASPASLSFGNEAVGSASAAQTVTVSNTGTAAATLSSVSAGAPFAETNACGSSLAAGASCTVSVKFTPTTAGAAAGNLSVASNAPGSPLTVGLTGTGTGTATGPYGGTPAAVPGTVQAANYDTGGQGVAYNVTSVNGSANSYRPDGVDLEACSDTGCGYDLGWTASGQWFKYTVNVATAGTYTVSFRLASPSGVTDALHIASSTGANLSGSISAPNTGGWQNWATVTGSVTLPAGVQTLTVDQDNAGWNVHDLAFAASTTSTTNLALNQPVTASSDYQSYVPSNVTDGNTSSYWESADGAAYPQTVTVNLGSAQSIGSITLNLPPATAWSTRTETLSVLGSANGTTFTQIVASAGYTFNPATGNTATISLPSGTKAQYVQLSFTANTGWSAAQLSEFQIHAP